MERSLRRRPRRGHRSEGTAFGYDVDEEMAKRWNAGVYNQGHSICIRRRRPGASLLIIEYPTMGGSYLVPVQPETNGVGSQAPRHAAVHPRVEIVIEKGRVKSIKGAASTARACGSC